MRKRHPQKISRSFGIVPNYFVSLSHPVYCRTRPSDQARRVGPPAAGSNRTPALANNFLRAATTGTFCALLNAMCNPLQAPFRQKKCRWQSAAVHFTCQWRRGFTLIEMMVVVFIISLLVSITAVAVNRAKEKARQTDCMSNLRQLGVAIVAYRADNRGRNPDWLSNLYPTYIDDKRIYVCRSDEHRGTGDCRPNIPEIEQLTQSDNSRYDATKLNDYGTSADGKNADINANSYFYEFSASSSPWTVSGVANPSWNDYKENQLAKGDAANGGGENNPVPYSSSRMPIVRCFHHVRFGKIRAYARTGSGSRSNSIILSRITLNVAYAGNVIISPLWWEGALEPGDKPQ